jgi:hypothetical protein
VAEDFTSSVLIPRVHRAIRRVKRNAATARRIARRAESIREGTVTRIYGEPVVGDLGEAGMARIGALMARLRLADAAEDLARELREVVRA